MIPLGLVAQIALTVGALLGVSLVAIVGLPRLRGVRGQLRSQCRAAYPYVGLLGVVLVVNALARDLSERLSFFIGLNITDHIYSIEGEFVAVVQSYATPPVTSVLSFVYIYGYVFLLAFPVVAYFVLDDLGPFRQTLLAYAFNYAIGVACYVLFIAYGPRNLLPELVDSLLYTNWPRAQLLTSQVNTNMNVFPSLHTSLSVTVVLLAYGTRRIYPAWLVLSVPLAVGVMVSTMYLGIHWAVDVVGGVVLAVLSVWLADRITDERGKQLRVERNTRRAVRAVGAQIHRGRRWLANR